jgi:hypothetical protein
MIIGNPITIPIIVLPIVGYKKEELIKNINATINNRKAHSGFFSVIC